MDAKTVLSQPLTLPSGEVLPNRLAKAAMSEGLADPRGYATEGRERSTQRDWVLEASGARTLQ